MTGFVEVQFPPWISFWATGGRSFQTVTAMTRGGQEYRNRDWLIGLGKWDVQDALMTINKADPVQGVFAFNTVRDLFDVVAAQWGGFRWKDWKDYLDEGNGIMGTGVGTGLLTYQMNKRVTVGGNTYTGIINKPRPTGGADACTLKFNGSTAGGATYDPVTGLGTYVPSATQPISSVTVGSPTVVHMAAALTGLAVGKMLYISGVGSTAAAVLNGFAFPVTSLSGGDATITVNTTGLASSGGTAALGPQPTDAITWVGQYDIAVRFATDEHAIGPDQSNGGIYDWQSMDIREIRNP